MWMDETKIKLYFQNNIAEANTEFLNRVEHLLTMSFMDLL